MADLIECRGKLGVGIVVQPPLEGIEHRVAGFAGARR